MRKISVLLLVAFLANSIPAYALRVEQPEHPASQFTLARRLNDSSGLEEVKPLWTTDLGKNRIWQTSLLPGAQRRIAAITTTFLHIGDLQESPVPALNLKTVSLQLKSSESYRGMVVGPVTDSGNQFLAMGSTSGRVVVRDLNSEDAPTVVLGDTRSFQASGSVAIDPDGKTVFVTGINSRVHAWNMETQTAVPNHPTASFFEPDSNEAKFIQDSDKRLTALTGKSQIQIWDSRDQTGWRWRPSKLGDLSVSQFSRTGKLIAVAQNNVIHLFPTDDRDRVRTLKEARMGKEITSLAFSPDSEYLIAGDKRGILHMWNIASSRATESNAQIQAHEGPISSLFFYTDKLSGRTALVSSGHDGNVKAWDLAALISAGLEEDLPDELVRATFSGERVPVRVLDLARDRPFFNAVYTAPDEQVKGFVPIARLFHDPGERMRVNQKWDRLMANGDEPIMARVDLQGGELHFYPDLELNALDSALNRLLTDVEKMVGASPLGLPAQVVKRVTGGKGAEVLYRLEDGSGRGGRGYLTVAGDYSNWLQQQIGHEIRVTPVGVDRDRSERQVIFRPAGLPLNKGALLEQKLLERSVPSDEIESFLDRQLLQDRELPKLLIPIYEHSRSRVWRNMTRSHRLAVLRWLAGRSDSADADLAGWLFHMFARASKDPMHGRTIQAWALRGMAGAARDDAQTETARQSVEAWFQRTPLPEPKHTAILDPVVYELFGWPQDAYALSLDVQARFSAGQEENTAAWDALQDKINKETPIKVRIGEVLHASKSVAIRYSHDGEDLPGVMPFPAIENLPSSYLADLFLLQKGQEIDVLPKQIIIDDLNRKQFTAFVGIAEFDFLGQRLQAIREIQRAAASGVEIEMELLGVVNKERGVVAFKYQSSAGDVVFKTYLSRFFSTGVTGNYPVHTVNSWVAYHTGKSKRVKIIPTEFQKGGSYPQVYFKVNLSNEELNQEIWHGRAELKQKFDQGHTVDFGVEWFSHNSVQVFYIGEQGWARTIVPMSLLFDASEQVSLDDTQEWVLRSVGDLWRGVPLVSNRDGSGYPIVGNPKFSARRALDQVEPALQELREMAGRSVPPEITVIARMANSNGLAVLYEGKNGSWKRGYIDIREVKPTGASPEQRRQWMNQAIDRKIHVTLRAIKTPESSTKVYFSWPDPERDLHDDFGAGILGAGQEEAYAYMGRFMDKDPLVRRAARNELLRRGDAAIPIVIELFGLISNSRIEMVQTVRVLAAENPSFISHVIEPIRRHLDGDPEWGSYTPLRNALMTLSALSPEQASDAIPLLERLLSREERNRVIGFDPDFSNQGHTWSVWIFPYAFQAIRQLSSSRYNEMLAQWTVYKNSGPEIYRFLVNSILENLERIDQERGIPHADAWASTEPLIEAAVQPVHQLAEQEKPLIVLVRSDMVRGDREDIPWEQISRQLSELTGYPSIQVDDSSSSRVLGYQRSGNTIIHLVPEDFPAGYERVMLNTVRVKLGTNKDVERDMFSIELHALPGVITGALAHWQQYQNEAQIPVFNAIPYMNLNLLSAADVWQILADQFA